ncbi:MAG TPA: HK97 gp10 family phage protein [Paracoccus solventivorans]|uniref:HK97 gp10 family phage protein n=1 Tax=Paracoccus solventivorans TaxID=53463 RepID=A0A832QW97_9RHOB|nr:HK97 gp10 family phage protein [Paracoccus solventivorans]HHW34337.1 HK97 gp10 family phage protein [Paracoccus solventivorans]
MKSSDALAARLAAIAPEIKAKLVPALTKSAQEVAGRAEALAEASRRSGDLIERIEVVAPGGVVTAGDESAQLHDLQAAVVATAPHSHLVEHGTGPRQHKDGGSTGAMPAQPFLLPAWRLSKPRVDRRINRAITAGIKAAAGNGGGDA